MGESPKDPVCGATVLPGRITAVFLGVEHSFCSVACRDRFLAYPHQYAGLRGQRRRGAAVRAPPAATDAAPTQAGPPAPRDAARRH